MQAAAEGPQAQLQDFDEVIRLHWHHVHRFILSSVRDADAAQTLTQDCFLRAYSARQEFRGEASVSTWLMQIAVNLVRDFSRNRRVRFWKRLNASAVNPVDISDRIQDVGSTPEDRALLRERVLSVWQACRSLPERQRTVFLLRFVEDMDLLEIAAVTGMKEGTVKSHLFRALQSIRKRLRRSE
jgi:RNA polymerase sigma-70 factor (ECF subfamily)